MKRKIFTLLVATLLLLSACGNNEKNSDTTSTEDSLESSADSSIAETETTEELSDIEAIGDIEVDENLFSVELTIPADFVGETTQEELDSIATEKGFKSIVLHDDGSATYTMTKAQHKEMMDEMADSINSSLAEMVGSENYPNFTGIKTNDNFTEFTITTKSTELDMSESFSVITFYMYGGMYNIFNGTPVDNVSVTFINADSGEVISSSNSADSGQ